MRKNNGGFNLGKYSFNANKANLFQLVRSGQIEYIKDNLTKIDINMLNEFGQSLLHEAIAYKQYKIASMLIKKSIDVNIQDYKGQSALHYISFYLDIDIANEIVSNTKNLNLADDFGNTALWYAVFNSRGIYNYVELLLEYEVDIYSENKAGRSPLDFARQIKDYELIDILLKKK